MWYYSLLVEEVKTIKDSKESNKNSISNFNFNNFINIHGELNNKNTNINSLDISNKNYFTKIPNELVKANLQKDYLINRIVLVVFTLIHQNMSIKGTSFVTVRMILEKCNYICGRNKKIIFYEVVKSILFLADSGYIKISYFDPEKINYDECIYVTINQELFLPTTNFTKLYWNDFDKIMISNDLIKNESLLNLFLYISAFIGCRPKDEKGNELLEVPSDHPEAFWQSASTICKNLSMSKRTVNDGLNVLLQYELLIKYDLGFKSSKDEPDPHHYPNIYVLNKAGFDQEIKWAIPIVLKESNHKEGGN